ncbi:MAG: CYTH domain-containing protein [Kiritimatiellae bacterium]|nr:CYTH domain-containing protein [Kiritimatiellia bacterium]MCO5067426.1 CYTH domain-containing protein [Kiritimatiellia bacterium]
MNQEIERKFLVRNDAWRAHTTAIRPIRQAYLCADPHRSVRIRIAGADAWLTIKGATQGLTRAEYEYPIPHDHALDILDHLCTTGEINKTRHLVPHGTLMFEVDIFHGKNEGLTLAEIELPTPDTPIQLPPWIGQEVTGDPRYFNAYLARHPFTTWPTT